MALLSITRHRTLLGLLAALLVLPLLASQPGQRSATAQQDPYPTFESLCGINSPGYNVASCRSFLGTLTEQQRDDLYDQVGLLEPEISAASSLNTIFEDSENNRKVGIEPRAGYPGCYTARSERDQSFRQRWAWSFYVRHNWCVSTTNASRIRCSGNNTSMDAEESAFWTWEGQSGSTSRNKRQYAVNGQWQDPCTSTAYGTLVYNEHRFRGQVPNPTEGFYYCIHYAAMGHADYYNSATNGFWRWRQVRENCS